MTIQNNTEYRNNPLLKRSGVKIEFTKDQIKEYRRCSDDPIYFIKKYVKIISLDDGVIPFKMWEFQEKMIETFHNNRFSILKLLRQCGKALDIETPILTPNGFKKLKDIVVGDKIYGPDGKETEVNFITPVMNDRPCYEVEFSNGDKIIADEEHLWTIKHSHWKNKEKVLNTKEILEILDKNYDNRPYIDFTKPLDMEEKDLPIDPYTLGVWLGDGNSRDGRITCHKDDIETYKKYINFGNISPDYRNSNVLSANIIGLNKLLRENNLLKNKHIPNDYLISSFNQRLNLIKGLMDTDGSVKKNSGSCEFYQKNEELIDQVKYLLSSLGVKSSKTYKLINGIRYFTLRFTSELSLFNLERKKNIQKYLNHQKNKKLYIKSITKVDSVPVRCLQVTNKEHMFLAGNDLIPTHNTTTTVSYLLWVILFREEQTIAILANKGSTARDILGRLQKSYESLPLWIQQGILEWNKGSIELENGSKVIAASTSSSAIRGGSYNIIALDEFAHVPTNIATEFFTSVYPTITSGKNTKMIIISTPNGMNTFYKIWTDAVSKKNSYIPFEVHWSQIPGRDQKWKEETIKNIGDRQFRQEFETEFLGSSNTLISGSKLAQLVYKDPIEYKNIAGDEKLYVYEYPVKGNNETTKDHLYGICVDVAEGKEMDASAFSVFDISTTPYRQVAKYSSNAISPLLYPTVILNAAKYYNDAYVLVEVNNTPQIAEILHTDLEYENLLKVVTGNKKPQTISAGFGRGVQLGLKMTALAKRVGCANLRTLIEDDKLILQDYDTITELTKFVQSGTSYEAEEGENDDLVMGLVIFSWMTTQKYFKDIVNHDLRKQLQLEQMDIMEMEMLPGPMIDNGLDVPFILEGGDMWFTPENFNQIDDFFKVR